MSNTQRKFVIRPRARLMSVLGEDMIRDQAVGLIELVKNAYDADATEVLVELNDLKAGPDQTVVIVTDNGLGMSLADIEGKWLSPAVAHKELSKKGQRRSPRGRLPIGEKGVGRFAVQKIGRRLELVTRCSGELEHVVYIDWDLFMDADQYLEDIPITVTSRSPQVFVGDKTGTKLTMFCARNPWTEALLSRVQSTIRRLQPPLAEERQEFVVRLQCPDNQSYQNTDSSDILNRAHYVFRAAVLPQGQCDYEYSCSHPAVRHRKVSRSDNLAALAKEPLKGDLPKCGPFYINLYVWDRTAGYLTRSGVNRTELDAYSGVALFRDGLRVLPYGELGDDWLFLDQDRIQKPQERIGNNQVIGLVMVDQANNLLLRDKTNREGLIENEAFIDLRIMIRAAIALFTSLWKNDRPKPENEESKAETVSIERLRDTAKAIRNTARDDVRVTVPPKPDPAKSSGPTRPLDAEKVPAAPTPSAQSTQITQRQALDLLLRELEDVQSTLGARERRLQVLTHLAATGMAAERVVHEFGRQVNSASEALKDLKSLIGSQSVLAARLSVVEASLITLRNEFRVLAPYEGMRRAESTRETNLRSVVELALALNRQLLAENGVDWAVSGEDFSVRVREGALVQVFDNLINNAAYWVSTRPDTRRVEVTLMKEECAVLVSDNGPGVHPEAVPQLGKAFCTMKANGRGLGLYISTELIRGLGGQLRLVNSDSELKPPSWAVGANFLVMLGTQSASK